MRISQKGIDLIKSFEGFRSEAYICPGGVVTIGYGHTDGVNIGDTITKEEAEELLTTEVNEFASAVNKCISVELTQNQFDALVSLCYNIGKTGFFNSPVRRLVNEAPRNYELIKKAFLRHTRAKGQVLPGLVRRREEEFKLYSDE